MRSCTCKMAKLGKARSASSPEILQVLRSGAIQLVLNYYFAELRYQKVTVGIVSYNEASIALHEKHLEYARKT